VEAYLSSSEGQMALIGYCKLKIDSKSRLKTSWQRKRQLVRRHFDAKNTQDIVLMMQD